MRPDHIANLLLAAVAVVHLLPLAGVAGVERLAALYGIRVDDAGLELLLRHRAVLFGVIGGVLLAGVWRPEYRTLACAVGLVSVVSFLLLAAMSGGLNDALRRVVVVDVVAAVALVAVVAIDRWSS
ncbi:MAG: phosphopantetheine adenylyltransferase [Pseudomonadota bacterium]